MIRFRKARSVLVSCFLVAGLRILPSIGVASARAAAPDDHILPVEQHTSEKARQLATTYAAALRDFALSVYHCMPWVEIHPHSVGFFKRKHASQDDRYLSVRVFIEQDASPQFASLTAEQRASSMFSRYGGSLLRRMAANRALLADPALGGFALILEWRKQAPPRADGRPVHETIAAFIERSAVAKYLSGAAPIRDLAARARVLGFDGETPLGPMQLSAWDDTFVATHRIKSLEPPAGISCR